MPEPRVPRFDVRRHPLALVVAFTVLGRALGLHSGSGDIAGLWLSDTLTLSGWLDPIADLAVTAAFVKLSIELLLGPVGLPAHLARERVALVPTAAFFCAGGGAMSATMATVMFGAVFGVEIFVVVSLLLVVAVVSLAAMSAAMVLVGLRVYDLFERLLSPEK